MQSVANPSLPELPVTGKNTGKMILLFVPQAFKTSIPMAFLGFSLEWS
jgi:hypothetical protein